MSEITKILSDNLRRLRRENNLTQSDLAEKVDLSLASIQAYESGRTWPGVDIVRMLAQAFRISEHSLFESGPPEMPPTVGALTEIIKDQEILIEELKSQFKRFEKIPSDILDALLTKTIPGLQLGQLCVFTL